MPRHVVTNRLCICMRCLYIFPISWRYKIFACVNVSNAVLMFDLYRSGYRPYYNKTAELPAPTRHAIINTPFTILVSLVEFQCSDRNHKGEFVYIVFGSGNRIFTYNWNSNSIVHPRRNITSTQCNYWYLFMAFSPLALNYDWQRKIHYCPTDKELLRKNRLRSFTHCLNVCSKRLIYLCIEHNYNR